MQESTESVSDLNLKLDIISLASSYGVEFKKPSGSRYRAKVNPFREENTSSVDFFSDTNRYLDRGDSSIKGDAIDLIAFFDKCSNPEAIAKAKEMVGSDTYNVQAHEIKAKQKPKEKKIIDFSKMDYQAKMELQASEQFKPKMIEVEFAEDNGFVNPTKSMSHVFIFSHFERLFETTHLEPQFLSKISYIFKHLVGFSSFWKSPTIILRDREEKVVDVVAYRPKDKETGEEISGMKYYYKNFDQRGENFVFPFENLVNRIVKREKYIIIGEGLKNALNALVYDVPFVSIESTGNVLALDAKLLEAIKTYQEKGYGIACAFDGDEAGQKAYDSFCSLSGIDAPNLFEFDSKIDFVEYVRGTK